MFTATLTASLASSAGSLTRNVGMKASPGNGENLHHDWLVNGRAKLTGPPAVFPSLFVAIIYVLRLLSWCANDGSGCSVDSVAWRALACSPSLNSPRSNLQTAAEFWQILPRCFLPLGDTFFIYFSSPPLWYSVHGALAPQAIVSSVLCPCLKNQMDLQGLLSTPPFMNMAQSNSSTLIFILSALL